MDPKQQLNQLDPKLKEAYERVMGTPVGATPAQPGTPTAATSAPTPAAPQPMPANQFAGGTTPVQAAQSPQTMPPNPPQMPTVQPIQPAMPATATPPHVQPPVQPPAAFGTTQPAAVPAVGAHPTPPQGKPGAASHGFVAGKKGLRMSPVLLIVGGIIFLLVYTVFWLKFFNIPLPFPIPFLSQ